MSGLKIIDLHKLRTKILDLLPHWSFKVWPRTAMILFRRSSFIESYFLFQKQIFQKILNFSSLVEQVFFPRFLTETSIVPTSKYYQLSIATTAYSMITNNEMVEREMELQKVFRCLKSGRNNAHSHQLSSTDT